MKTLFVLASLSLLATPAFAKKGSAQNHHCVAKDGSDMDATTTRKQCKKAGGKWAKGAPGASTTTGTTGSTTGTTTTTPSK